MKISDRDFYKYSARNTGNRVPVKSNKQYSGYLKEIQALYGIQTWISSHILRHRFATVIALSTGIPIETFKGKFYENYFYFL